MPLGKHLNKMKPGLLQKMTELEADFALLKSEGAPFGKGVVIQAKFLEMLKESIAEYASCNGLQT